MDIPNNVINKKLYAEVKKEISKKMPKSSAYRSGLIVKTYKDRGGTYKGVKPKKGGLKSWFKKEKWINVLEYLKGNIVTCSQEGIDTSACRPLNKGDRGVLTIKDVIKKHGKEKVKTLAEKKKKNLNLKINWSKGTIK
jgi:hypothetical protein